MAGHTDEFSGYWMIESILSWLCGPFSVYFVNCAI